MVFVCPFFVKTIVNYWICTFLSCLDFVRAFSSDSYLVLYREKLYTGKTCAFHWGYRKENWIINFAGNLICTDKDFLMILINIYPIRKTVTFTDKSWKQKRKSVRVSCGIRAITTKSTDSLESSGQYFFLKRGLRDLQIPKQSSRGVL